MTRSRTFGAALVLACTAQAFAAEASIELLPQVRVDAGAVTLGHLALLRSTQLDLIQALVDLPVGRAPPAGQTVMLQRETLDAWIRQRLRMPADITWQGAAESHITADSRKVSGDRIAAAAGAQLGQWLARRSERSEVQLAWSPRDIDAPPGTVHLKPRPLGASALRARMTVWVDVWAGERFVRTVPVSFAVTAWRTAATAAREMDIGTALGPADVVLQQVDLTRLDEPAPRPSTPGDSLRLRRSVPAGEVIRARDLAPAPLVQRGQWASLRSGAGAVVSEARVEVLQDGRAGENVRVRQPGAAVQLVARVVGPGRLEIVR